MLSVLAFPHNHVGGPFVARVPFVFHAATFAPSMMFLVAIDLCLHAGIDRAKVSCRRFTPSRPAFWRIHGIDQEAHHLTYVADGLAIILAGAG